MNTSMALSTIDPYIFWFSLAFHKGILAPDETLQFLVLLHEETEQLHMELQESHPGPPCCERLWHYAAQLHKWDLTRRFP